MGNTHQSSESGAPDDSDSSKYSRYRWRICALLFFATTINYIDRQVISILTPLHKPMSLPPAVETK